MALSGTALQEALSIADVGITGSVSDFEKLATCYLRVNLGQRRAYESAWKGVLDAFDAAHAVAEGLADMLAILNSPTVSDGLVNPVVRRQLQHIAIDPGCFRPTKEQIVVVEDSVYRQRPCASVNDDRFIAALANVVTPATQAVVELGAGWGRNLAAIALRLGRSDLAFIGGEQSASGQACITRLMGVENRFNGVGRPFDFYDADLEFLSGFNEVTVFTHAAIEQIAFLPANFIDRVLRAAPRVRLLLFEPFGWQANRALARNILHRSVSAMMQERDPSKIAQEYRFRLADEVLDQNAAVWALGGTYNMNLLSVIRKAEMDGTVRVERLTLNMDGRNLFNPYSLAVLALPSR